MDSCHLLDPDPIASVQDPHHIDADPDPTFYFDADSDPDPSFHIKAQNLENVLK
jgi:hypothetical protein